MQLEMAAGQRSNFLPHAMLSAGANAISIHARVCAFTEQSELMYNGPGCAEALHMGRPRAMGLVPPAMPSRCSIWECRSGCGASLSCGRFR